MKAENIKAGQLWVYRNLGAAQSFDLIVGIECDASSGRVVHFYESWNNGIQKHNFLSLEVFMLYVSEGRYMLLEGVK